jgi:hypothetical protein
MGRRFPRRCSANEATARFVESAGKGYVRLRSGKDDVFERNAVPRIHKCVRAVGV